ILQILHSLADFFPSNLSKKLRQNAYVKIQEPKSRQRNKPNINVENKMLNKYSLFQLSYGYRWLGRDARGRECNRAFDFESRRLWNFASNLKYPHKFLFCCYRCWRYCWGSL
ncbi:hypothetical protein V8G54_007504, partial [Vigna mungo]